VEKYPDTSDFYSEIGEITRCSKVSSSSFHNSIKKPMFLIQIDFDELEQKLNKLENDCRAAFDYLRAISKHETAQIKTKYV
jgi:hypothetical protein